MMLSGESAYGSFPYKAVDVMSTVSKHTEASMLSYAVSFLLSRGGDASPAADQTCICCPSVCLPLPYSRNSSHIEKDVVPTKSLVLLQGTRRYGSNEAEAIDWIVPSARREDGRVMALAWPCVSKFHLSTATIARASLSICPCVWLLSRCLLRMQASSRAAAASGRLSSQGAKGGSASSRAAQVRPQRQSFASRGTTQGLSHL